MKISTTDHIELHYSTFGDRKDTPVVLIHGLGAARDMWEPQMESLPGEGLFLIVPDMRGEKLVVADSFSEVASLSEKLGGWMQWLTMKLLTGKC
jgi:triacylglycerol esterase/lipase EstA (alpha/beta hydrolase family)